MAPQEQNGKHNTVLDDRVRILREQALRWYEVVRGLRAFYDHFRIAFPHLEELPKFYTDEWAEEFKNFAREFVRTENMDSVRKVLVGAGYGTDEWAHIAEIEIAEIEQAFARLLEAVEQVEEQVAEIETSDIKGTNTHTKDRVTKSASGDPDEEDDDTLEVLKRRFEESRKENRALLGDVEARDQRIVELEGQIRRQEVEDEEHKEAAQRPVSASEDEERELDALKRRFEVAKKENHDLQNEIGVQKKQIVDLEGQLRRLKRDNPEVEVKAVVEDKNPDPEPEQTEGLLLQRRFDELQSDYQSLQEKLEHREEEVRSLNEQMKKLTASLEKASEAGADETQKFKTPSSMGAQTREYEQKLKASALLIEGMKSELERAKQAVEEYKEDLNRQRALRRKFEEELESEREELRRQTQQLKRLLAEGGQLPTIEEFEEMEADQLLEYIEDVETEKQRAIAGLEALEAQEESYQKQLNVQQEELGAIQEDLERHKDSNLATEMEDSNKTIEAQREQLETLLSFSKNLKAQVNHLKERQEPLRGLVERLNLQEKALIRYIRMNFERGFMPNQAYDKDEMLKQ